MSSLESVACEAIAIQVHVSINPVVNNSRATSHAIARDSTAAGIAKFQCFKRLVKDTRTLG